MTPDTDVRWTLAPLDALDARTAHDLFRLRIDVFVVEQACAYPELDGRDALPGTRHLIGRVRGGVVAGGRTLVDARDADAPARIGRVVVAASHRRRGLARELMRRLLADLDARAPDRDVVLGAQLPAESLYAAFGFRRCSDEYVEDGMSHVDMRLARG